MAKVKRHYRPTSLVDGDGNFNTDIEQDLNLADEKCPVFAVSIMGVQSTGKSTLLNECFSTDFEEMDENEGMSQTTKGIWIAKCPSLDGGRKILVIDTEGIDGSERGRQGDDTFEKKITLFALAMSNTVIFNMKCDNVNLYQGASRPLLETVFKVMLHKFSTSRQVNLVFILRDKNRCPLDKLRSQLIRGVQEIWQGMSKPRDNMNAALEDYFKIEVMAMSNYVYQREEFDKEVDNLRDKVFSLVQHGESGRASAFTALAQRNWKEIMEDRILNLNLNRITVELVDVSCHDIAEKKLQNFHEDKSWLQINEDVKSGTIVKGFGKAVSSIIGKYLSQYDKEIVGADERERDECRKQLTEKLLEVVEGTHLSLVENMRKTTSENFRKEIFVKIEDSGKLEGVNGKKFITEFKNLLKDAHVQQANWNHTDQQLEQLTTELASYEEKARSVIKKLEELKKNKEAMWACATKFGVEAVYFAIVLVLSISAARPVVAIARASPALKSMGIYAAPTLGSITAIILAFIKYHQAKQDFQDARQDL